MLHLACIFGAASAWGPFVTLYGGLALSWAMVISSTYRHFACFATVTCPELPHYSDFLGVVQRFVSPTTAECMVFLSGSIEEHGWRSWVGKDDDIATRRA